MGIAIKQGWVGFTKVLFGILGIYGGNSVLAINSLEAGNWPDAVNWGNPTCAVMNSSEIAKKNALRKSSLNSPQASEEYKTLLSKHKTLLEQCRSKTWPQTQAIWLRLYPNDAKPGVLEDVLDRIVNRGYNQVYIEVFYDGRVLLPVSDNNTPWRSVTEEAVKAGTIAPDYDLWAEAIKKAHDRGLKVYGWAFTLNFGYGYSERSDRANVLARNGHNETSIANSQFDPKAVAEGKAFYLDAYEPDHLFVDPYSDRARADLTAAVTALHKRQPDGMLFDYVRYPTSFSSDSLVSNVKQLWIYGEASRKALLNSIPNATARQLMSIYMDKGTVTAHDIAGLENHNDVLIRSSWTLPVRNKSELARTAEMSERFLWQVAIDHAYKGVLSFVSEVTQTLRQENVPVGTVFFPGGNLKTEGGFDARMQPWDRFPKEMQRHPMTYAKCADGSCVASQVLTVVQQSAPTTLVCPILAGTWGEDFDGHPSYEIQMQAIRKTTPQISCISHFVYAWMEPESDQQRKAGIATGN